MDENQHSQFRFIVSVITLVIVVAVGVAVTLVGAMLWREKTNQQAKIEALEQKLQITPADVLAEVRGQQQQIGTLETKLQTTPSDVLAEIQKLRADVEKWQAKQNE